MKNTMRMMWCGVLSTGLLAWMLPATPATPATLAAAEAKPAAKAEVTRTVLRRQDLDVPGREVVMIAVVVPPGVAEELHTHPADLFTFVEQGDLTLELEGEPTVTYHAGDTVRIPGNKKHRGINNGQVTVKLAAVQVAYKGQPLTVPAP